MTPIRIVFFQHPLFQFILVHQIPKEYQMQYSILFLSLFISQTKLRFQGLYGVKSIQYDLSQVFFSPHLLHTSLLHRNQPTTESPSNDPQRSIKDLIRQESFIWMITFLFKEIEDMILVLSERLLYSYCPPSFDFQKDERVIHVLKDIEKQFIENHNISIENKNMISLLSTSKEPLSPPSDLTSGRTTVNCLNKQIKNINYVNEYSFTNVILSKGTIQDKRLLDQQVCSILFSFIFQRNDEREAKLCCQKIMNEYDINVIIIDTEFQFDRKKLTVYYKSEGRIDYKSFIKDMYLLYNARIWMQKV